MSELFTLTNAVAGYGPLTILHEVSFSISEGERVCLIGRNGVGKSTTLKTIMGLTQWRSGAVHWRGQDVTRSGTVHRSRMGIGYVPQTRDVFPSLTVEENLVAGLRNQPRSEIERAYRWFPRLKERRGNGGSELSGGEQQMLAVARALMLRPRLLLLDEPSLGLAPIITQGLFKTLAAIREETGMTMLIVEQSANLALEIADSGVVLESGQIVLRDTARNLAGNDEVRRIYLGYE